MSVVDVTFLKKKCFLYLLTTINTLANNLLPQLKMATFYINVANAKKNIEPSLKRLVALDVASMKT